MTSTGSPPAHRTWPAAVPGVLLRVGLCVLCVIASVAMGDGPLFQVRLCSEGSDTARAVLVVAGELDMASAEGFVSAVVEVVPGGRPIVVDARNLSFCDSSGLQAFVRLRQHAGGTREALRIGRRSTQISDLFALGGLDEIFADDNEYLAGIEGASVIFQLDR